MFRYKLLKNINNSFSQVVKPAFATSYKAANLHKSWRIIEKAGTTLSDPFKLFY